MVRGKARKRAGGEATGGIIKCTFRRFRYNLTERWMRGVCEYRKFTMFPTHVQENGPKRKKILIRLNQGKMTTEAYL